MPVGTGHSVEAQMTGEETTAGIQFKITQLEVLPKLPSDRLKIAFASPGEVIQIMVCTLTGKRITCNVGSAWTIEALKDLIEVKEDIPTDQQRIIYNGKQLEGKDLSTRLKSRCIMLTPSRWKDVIGVQYYQRMLVSNQISHI
jgi:hypothetical protein